MKKIEIIPPQQSDGKTVCRTFSQGVQNAQYRKNRFFLSFVAKVFHPFTYNSGGSQSMCKMLRIILVLCSLNCVFGNFIGPFVLWGRSELQTFDVPALESVDDKLLRNLYSESTAIVMFLRNSSNSLNVQNYPKFKDIIDESQWTYLSQHWLSSDPIDYNTNTEVIGRNNVLVFNKICVENACVVSWNQTWHVHPLQIKT